MAFAETVLVLLLFPYEELAGGLGSFDGLILSKN